MSYDLYFIKQKNLSIQDSLALLEKQPTSKEHQFSETETKNMVAEIVGMNQHTSVENGKDSTEINYDGFQINLNKSQLAISIPYVKENLSQKITVQVNCIIDIFLENDCVGLDGQIEEFIDDDYSFKTVFAQSLNVVSASKKSETKALKFETREEAEKFYFKKRDKILSLVDKLKEAYPKRKLDFSPESLKHLEWVFYEGLDNEAFGKTLPTKEEFYELLSMYKAKVYVDHKGFNWNICENIFQETFQLAIQTKKGLNTIFVTAREDFEDNPDGKKQALLKEFGRDV